MLLLSAHSGRNGYIMNNVEKIASFTVDHDLLTEGIYGTEIEWTSSDESVVFFSNGKLYAIGTGTVTLTATSGLLTAKKTITVVEGGNVRKVNFTPMANMHFIVEDYYAVFNGAAMNWSDDYEIRFRVYPYSSFAFETYIVYINGVEAGRGVPEHTNIADTLTIGHDNPQRAWAADLYSVRFYDRALTPAELRDNSEADDEKYRFGLNYPPVVRYDDSDETFEDSVSGDYKNNVIPMDPALDLIATDGFYGTHSINKELYGDWTGVRVAPNAEYDIDAGGLPLDPMIQINYSKFCRKTGVTLLDGDSVSYAVVKYKLEGGNIGKVNMYAAAGDYHSWFEARDNGCMFANENEIKATGEVAYLIYDLSYSWEGVINIISLEFTEMDANAIAYVEEIQLFNSKEEAYAYAGEEIPTKAPATEEPTTEPAGEVTTDKAETTTEAEKSEGGCKSAVAMSMVAFVAVAAACVALKKKD